MWTGGLPHLSGLPHLPGFPQLHVNRPLVKWLFWAADVKEWLFTFFTFAFKDYFEMYFAFMHTPRAPQPNPQSSLIPKNT